MEFIDDEIQLDDEDYDKQKELIRIICIHKHKHSPWFGIYKDDVIKLAKIFKLSEKDLET